MAILSWILLGLAAAAIARAISRGDREPVGVPGTIAVSMLGAVLGGLVASAVGIGSIASFFSFGTWIAAVLGALLLLALYNAAATGSPRHLRGT